MMADHTPEDIKRPSVLLALRNNNKLMMQRLMTQRLMTQRLMTQRSMTQSLMMKQLMTHEALVKVSNVN
jgi:hypothetical protein